jgi:signal transduction histidine kinase
LSLRTRIVVASVGPSLVLLLVLLSIVYVRVREQRLRDLDHRLEWYATTIATYVEYDGTWELDDVPDALTDALEGFRVRSAGTVLVSGGVLRGRTWRGSRPIEREGPGPDEVEVTVAIDPAPVDRELELLLRDLALAGAALGALALGAGLVLGGRIVSSEEFLRLQAAWERQAAFAADASHELRTPVAVIKSAAEVALRRPRVEAEYEEALRAVLSGALRMEALLEALLVLARGDEIVGEDVDLVALVRDLARELPPPPSVALRVDGPPRAATRGDRRLLAIALRNLLGNAFRHTREGSVTVRIERVPDAWHVVVSDTGEGIDAAHLSRVFDRFYRVDAARSSRHGGAGLGLAVVRTIVERHGGRVVLASEPGRGTVVTIALPAV